MTPAADGPSGLHTGDYAAWYKHATGDWICNAKTGEIIHRRTGKPVSFRLNNEGYLHTTARVRGKAVDVLKHRAVWTIAHGIFGIPIEYALEVDHINHDKLDCRLNNLRLITRIENCRNRPGSISRETAWNIRIAHASGTLSRKELAEQYQVSLSTIRRILAGNSHKESEL